MKRAVDESQKELRRQGILRAAYDLFEESDGELPAVIEIAQRSGVAKGTLYLYFKTREEIYLTLLNKFMKGWFHEIDQAFEEEIGLEGVLDTCCDYIAEHHTFMRLASIFNGILERNIDFQTALNFKTELRDRLIVTGKKIHSTYPDLGPEDAVKLLLRSFALCVGLWQIAEPAPILREVLKDKDLSILALDFDNEIKSALASLWYGSLSQVL